MYGKIMYLRGRGKGVLFNFLLSTCRPQGFLILCLCRNLDISRHFEAHAFQVTAIAFTTYERCRVSSWELVSQQVEDQREKGYY